MDIYDLSGVKRAEFTLIQLVPEATEVSVFDVSALPNSAVTVAAVFTKEGQSPAASLLSFDFDGKLRAAYALPPSREAERIALDDGGNVWTLTHARCCHSYAREIGHTNMGVTNGVVWA